MGGFLRKKTPVHLFFWGKTEEYSSPFNFVQFVQWKNKKLLVYSNSNFVQNAQPRKFQPFIAKNEQPNSPIDRHPRSEDKAEVEERNRRQIRSITIKLSDPTESSRCVPRPGVTATSLERLDRTVRPLFLIERILGGNRRFGRFSARGLTTGRDQKRTEGSSGVLMRGPSSLRHPRRIVPSFGSAAILRHQWERAWMNHREGKIVAYIRRKNTTLTVSGLLVSWLFMIR